jgi:formamidopyrimidine-DNA glycosylase
MPELPEIEHLKRSLEPALIGARVQRVRLTRPDIVRTITNGRTTSATTRRPAQKTLLAGSTITQLARHGKQLAIISNTGENVCVHLGMSGSLRFVPSGTKLNRRDHVHCRWTLEAGTLVFRDPRRFGGLRLVPSIESLHTDCWGGLGPDALTIDADDLFKRLQRTTRDVKAALLDQSLVAGLGNIYVDESLFAAGIHPQVRACDVTQLQTRKLHVAARSVLQQAIDSGGSTLRDYADGNGRIGTFKSKHNVYGRDGQPCTRCGGLLVRMVVSQRGTVYCSHCQKRS